ncbi:MAG: hypothetical protein ACO1TE_26625 [Prosthecobacter sp.]
MRAKIIKMVLLLLAAVAFWWLGRPQVPQVNEGKAEPGMSNAALKAMEEAARLRAQGSAELPGEEILKEYARPGTRPEDDLHSLAHAFSNLLLVVKGGAPFRMGANEEFAAALMGKNANKLVFLAPPHACLNAQGQLVDRWQTPLFFHVRDAGRIDIRTAGPDKAMWTEDDLQRQADGQFVRGKELPEDRMMSPK